jgi:hypothetical protein
MAAVLLTTIFVLGFLLGYVLREIISQRRQRRALMQRERHDMRNPDPGPRVD